MQGPATQGILELRELRAELGAHSRTERARDGGGRRGGMRTLRGGDGGVGRLQGSALYGDERRRVLRRIGTRGSHSFRFKLNLSSSVHRVTQLNS